MAVVAHHALEMSNGSAGRFSPDWLTVSGAAGVDIFFVISGFIMIHTSFGAGRAPMTPLTFLKKRALRIYPFYWLCLIGMSLIFALGFLKTHAFGAAKLMLAMVLFPGQPLIYVAWTLSYEIFFYLVFAAALFSGRRDGTAILAVLAIGIAIAAGSLADLAFLANPISIEFCFGIGLALIAARLPKGALPLALGLAASGMVLLAAGHFPDLSASSGNGWTRVTVWGIPAVVIVAASLQLRRPSSRTGRQLLLIGDASYAIYLTHVFGMIAYGWAIKATPLGALPQLPLAVIVILACLAGGVLAHLWIEKPLAAIVRGDRPFRRKAAVAV